MILTKNVIDRVKYNTPVYTCVRTHFVVLAYPNLGHLMVVWTISLPEIGVGNVTVNDCEFDCEIIFCDF